MKTSGSGEERPNILLIYTDQQRWSALGANGNPHIRTPNLDQLAARGTNFDHCFVQNPVCMPSRISLFSGRYPSSLGITHMGVPVPETLPILPKMLKPYGYRTANFGKLHFLPHANRDHREAHPDYGFDCLEVSDEPGVYEDAYRAWVRAKAPDQLDCLSVGLPPARHTWLKMMGASDTVNHPSAEGRDDFKGAVVFPGREDVTHSAFVGARTVDYLSRQRAGGDPFFCVASFFAPHAPWFIPQRFLDEYDPQELGFPDCPAEDDMSTEQSRNRLLSARQGYYAAVTEVDYYVGQILEALEANGLAERTIIVFTSDHGEWLGEHGRWGKSCPGSDVISRVPMIVYDPRNPTGQACSRIVESVDLVPTLLDLAAIQPMSRLHGSSFAAAVRGQPFEGKEAALMEFNGWKNIRTESHRYLLYEDGREQLWDLEEDPCESRDVAADPARHEVLAKHRLLMLRRMLEMERPLPRSWQY